MEAHMIPLFTAPLDFYIFMGIVLTLIFGAGANYLLGRFILDDGSQSLRPGYILLSVIIGSVCTFLLFIGVLILENFID